MCSNRARNAQFSDFLQHLLNPGVEMTLRILISSISIKVLLDLSHPAVRFGTESELNLDKSLETGIQIRDTEVDKLREFGEELLVELLIGSLGHLGLLFCTRQLGDVFVGLFGELLDLGTHGIVVKEFVIALLNACDVVSLLLSRVMERIGAYTH